MASKKITDGQKIIAEEQLNLYQNKIDYDTKDYTLELLINKFSAGDFFIPEYQRKFIWKEKIVHFSLNQFYWGFLYHLCFLLIVKMVG